MLAPYSLQVFYDEGSHSFISSSFVTIFIGVRILANLEEFKLFKTNIFILIFGMVYGCFIWKPLYSLHKILALVKLSLVCGITTTGATIISDLDSAPKSILLWRAIMQWLGGIGIVVMAITILPLLKVGGMQLLKMEGPDSTEKILPRTIEVATIIISTYVALTLLCGFYWLFGMTVLPV